ncbi:CARDB domain-containing protein [Metabacillus herbersteinensis]|uniref:CARDB domain-containing protein n=1 Tax=Metabacillus herbersteinensis TaxID=283816 RepID=A0ABV6GLI7_9BACI
MKRITLCSLVLILLFGIYPFENIVDASQLKSVTTDNGTYTGTMGWEEKREYSYPQSWIGNFPATYEYDAGGYTGTLNAKKIILTPLEKIYHKDPIYRTENRNFTKTKTGTYSNKNSSNFSSNFNVNEDGYSGSIPRTGVTWTTNYNTGRKKTLTNQWTDTTFRVRTSDVPEPSNISGTYYDSGSGQNVSYSLPKSGGLYSIDNASTFVYSTSYGRAENYDRIGNTKLGYMSPNSTQYWSFTKNFSDSKPRPPSDYYGPDGGEFGTTGWTLVDYNWDECCVRDARNSAWHYKTAVDGYVWVSDAGLEQRYRKGVYLKYRKSVTGNKYRQNYSGTFNLPNTIKDYTGTATYKGSLSKQVFDYWNEYYTADKWKIQVVYEGTIYSTNLKADSIQIVAIDNTPVNHLVKGEEYKAKVIYSNNGDLDAERHVNSVYEDGTWEGGGIYLDPLGKGESRTNYYTFTPDETGLTEYTLHVNTMRDVKETTYTDNSVSTNIYVNTRPEITMRYDPVDVWEGDNVNVCATPTDEDNDLLNVGIYSRKDNNQTVELMKQNNVRSGQKVCVTIPKVEPGDYALTSTVDDGRDDNEVSTTFTAKELKIKGYVEHTPEWTEKHLMIGNLPNQFYSGEKYILKSDVSPYPIDYVSVYFSGYQVNGNLYTKTVSLSYRTNILRVGDLYDQAFVEGGTQLRQGANTFNFEVRYSNGIIKKDIVTTEIIGDVFDVFRIHKTK